jgi:hypothetical protein
VGFGVIQVNIRPLFDPNYEDRVEGELRAAVERAQAEFAAATPENRDERKKQFQLALRN